MGQCSYYLLKTARCLWRRRMLHVPGRSLRISIWLPLQIILLAQNQSPYVYVEEWRAAQYTLVELYDCRVSRGHTNWGDGISRVISMHRLVTAIRPLAFVVPSTQTHKMILTPEGDIETAVEPFADKWRTKDTCDFPTETIPGPHPCSANPGKRENAEKYCNWIMDDIFQDCHWTVEPEQYYEDCLYDVCACKDEPDKCFCPILAAYGNECTRQGIKTGWRMAVKECAMKCPMGQVYDECGDTCARTCSDLASKNSCKKECVEGCRCPHGEYLNENNECVPQQKCPCTYDGTSFKAGYKEHMHEWLWECEDAEPGDDEKYPPSSQLRAECANRPFAEFSKCAPKEPKTCKNMHEYAENLEDCTPGCVCMTGYVFDTSRKACVLPENCSCHHGGKSYSDGDKIKEDCNLWAFVRVELDVLFEWLWLHLLCLG
ncbi:unnamed protein product [Ceratitis capitata]|uniref:(Mediterranean fruit fly) hypothetical protein n=1 Tax=Ceratitis capitata TaxID=7213 RepID=A0A811V7B2_CERCA|nr:unnamed protein product [Ceratitis capitata]